jgi:hypothetical protein
MIATAQPDETLRNLMQRADQGDFNACAKVGHIYAAGDHSLGIEPNHALAIQYYDKGAQAGDLHCMYGLAGTVLPDTPDKAIELLETCAKGKYIWALATLGDLYLRGRHVAHDANKAFQYLQEYTTLCRPDKVGKNTFKVRWDIVLYPLCLLLGVGCNKDEKKARDVLTELATLGNLSAADILHTGKLGDWMAGKRFNFDIKANGPVALFNVAGQDQNQVSTTFASQSRVHKPHDEIIHQEHLSKFLQRSLIPGEPILMHAHFPRIYTIDACLRLFFFLGLGRWVEHLMAVHVNAVAATVPDPLYTWLYQYPQLPVLILGLYGVYHFLNMMIRKWTTEIVLTDRRFIYKHGLISIEMIQMNFWQIEHSDVTQSMLGNFLDYGLLHIQSYAVQSQEDPTGRKGMLILPLIAHPYLFSRLIEDNRRRPASSYSARGSGGGGAEVGMPWKR